MLDRKEEHLSAGNRPSSNQKLKIGAKKDGKLVAIYLENFGTAGVGTGAGASAGPQNMYPCPAVMTEDYDVFTHAGPAAAFRAPGHPQSVFAFEQMIDELAHKLDMDPLQLRDVIDQSDARRVERKIGAEKFGWSKRRAPNSDQGPIKRGMGVAQAQWYRFMNRDSHCEVRVTQDGSVELLSAVQDIGSGIRTALAMVVAEELGIKPADVTVKIGDTQFPNGPASGGSVTTNSISPAARDAAFGVRQKLQKHLGDALGNDSWKQMSFKQRCAKMKVETLSAIAQRAEDYPIDEDAKPQPGQRRRRGGGSGGLGGVQFVEVAVDTETGQVKVERVLAVHDCGRPINPLGVKNQINGGVIQGLSYALFENRLLDRNTGVMVNANLEEYKIAGAKDMPTIEPLLIEQYWGKSSTDAAGIGEPATVPTAAAIGNAVYNAIGVRIRQIPMTPRVVLAAIEAAKGAQV
jgi:xanthine dehydrogenase YagR molybdenum-binding subunit